jgi:hypothetical protein
MNLKLELFKGCIFMLMGAYLCMRFSPSPEQSKPEVSQVQMQDCQVVVKKVTKPDGSVDEITQFLSSSKQSQQVKPESKKSLSLDVGLASSKKAAIELQYNKFSYEVLTDFNKDHTHIIKYKVLEF